MKKMQTIEERYIECDACQYVIGLTRRERDEGQTVAGVTTELRIPWPYEADDRGDLGFLVFHFHGPEGRRRDCFRYWAHSPNVMQRSLIERGLPANEVEEFLATHLFRTSVS